MHARTGAAMCMATVLLVLPTACAPDAADGAAQCPPPVPSAPATAPSGLPRDLDLGSVARVTEVARDGEFVNVTAVAGGTLGEVQERFVQVLRRSGYAIVGSENEVVEADVFFARGRKTTGGAKFLQTGCDGRVRIQLFLGASKPTTD